MPDANGSLTQEEKLQVKVFLENNAPRLACPLTGETKWAIGDFLIIPHKITPEYKAQPIMLPQIYLISAAGAIIYLSATAVGLKLDDASS